MNRLCGVGCNHTRSCVNDSREEGDEKLKRAEFRFQRYRRRQCLDCGALFTTYELTEDQIDKLEQDTRTRLGIVGIKLRQILETCVSGKI